MSEQHKATPEQWADIEERAEDCQGGPACLLELRARVEALEAKYETMRLATLEWGKDVENLQRWSDQHLLRIERLETGATCPHIVTSDEGTSYCALAETVAPSPAGSLVERVAQRQRQVKLITCENYARAAIREVAAALREVGSLTADAAARWLEQEAER